MPRCACSRTARERFPTSDRRTVKVRPTSATTVARTFMVRALDPVMVRAVDLVTVRVRGSRYTPRRLSLMVRVVYRSIQQLNRVHHADVEADALAGGRDLQRASRVACRNHVGLERGDVPRLALA